MQIKSVSVRHADRSIWGHLAEREKTLPLVTPLDIYPQFQETRGSWFWDSGMAVVQIETDDGIVLVHDGVRPFVKPKHLIACIKGAQEHGACILGIPAFDTVKHVNAKNEIIETRKRDSLWLAQTPQAFQLKLIKKAHLAAKQDGFIGTDDASLVERLGEVVKIIPGSRSNIKITNREDLKLAQALLQIRASEP
jgi:2-C-methyl-D-erythritol 4-phosphate cytidylyltransferase